MKKQKILIVEDESILALELTIKLREQNFEDFQIVSSGEDAIEVAKKYKPNIILMDIMLRGKLNGIQAAIAIHHFSNVPIIYITANDHLKDDEQLIATKPVAVLSKPCSDCALFEALEKALSSTK